MNAVGPAVGSARSATRRVQGPRLIRTAVSILYYSARRRMSSPYFNNNHVVAISHRRACRGIPAYPRIPWRHGQ